MKTKILWDDKYTTIKQTAIRTTVTRHYSDTPDVITHLSNDIGNQLISDMHDEDSGAGRFDTMSSHYISRHVRDLYKTL